LEPSFYPIETSVHNEEFDPYNRYDLIPIKGFARSAFYFFIANTAKNIIKSAIQDDNLLSACETAIVECEKLLNDRGKIEYHSGLNRNLLDSYLEWRYKQTEITLAHNISLSSDDLWQHIFNEETDENTVVDESNKDILKEILSLLFTKEQWDKDELETICKSKGLMLGSILEEINDYSYSVVDDVVLEDEGDTISVIMDYKDELL
jgi:hypothetical protein